MQSAGELESLQRIWTIENHKIKRRSIIMHALQFLLGNHGAHLNNRMDFFFLVKNNLLVIQRLALRP